MEIQSFITLAPWRNPVFLYCNVFPHSMNELWVYCTFPLICIKRNKTIRKKSYNFLRQIFMSFKSGFCGVSQFWWWHACYNFVKKCIFILQHLRPNSPKFDISIWFHLVLFFEKLWKSCLLDFVYTNMRSLSLAVKADDSWSRGPKFDSCESQQLFSECYEKTTYLGLYPCQVVRAEDLAIERSRIQISSPHIRRMSWIRTQYDTSDTKQIAREITKLGEGSCLKNIKNCPHYITQILILQK